MSFMLVEVQRGVIDTMENLSRKCLPKISFYFFVMVVDWLSEICFGFFLLRLITIVINWICSSLMKSFE